MGEGTTSTSKSKYFTKTVRFGGEELVLYSLDGATWSTRRTELQAIKERQEAQRITIADIKGVDEEEREEQDSSRDDDEAPVSLNEDDGDTDKVVALPRKQAPSVKAKVAKLPSPKERAAPKAVPLKTAAKKGPLPKSPVTKPDQKKTKAAKAAAPRKVAKAKQAPVKGRKKAA